MLRFHAFLSLKLTAALLIAALCCTSAMMMKLNENDNGSFVEVPVGCILEITLEGNPSTGYSWALANVDTAILSLLGEPEFKPNRRRKGAAGKVTMRFEATHAGRTVLKLIYRRIFEKDKPPLKTIEVNIIVSN